MDKPSLNCPHLEPIMDISSITNFDIFIGSYSATVDLPLTMAFDNQIKIIAWYDNETGYSSRMIDLARYIADKED